ncbi:MAG: rhamnulokinase [Clostridia bacterium]|nr:rhamnulokinase [Clostridia bacterium]
MKYLAIDIGASSGRHIVGISDGGEIKTDEVYRFHNGVKKENGHLIWDIDELFENVVNGIRAALNKYSDIKSLAIDTWGVDYVLMDGDREIYPCYAYRDTRTEKAIGRVHEIIPFAELYSRTGIQFQPFNTIYQFFADKESGRLEKASDFLMIPEWLTYKLTGVKAHEYTNATTTGLVSASGEYDREIFSRLGFRLPTPPRLPGNKVGRLKPDIVKRVGGDLDVILCASHDTASAVEGIPMKGNSPYISSGTWSLLGVKSARAITDEESRKANYSNEGGVGYIRYQKNIMGMWVVNRLKDELCPNMPFDEIVRLARESNFNEIVDVNADAFLSPDSMMRAFDKALGARPATVADYFNCAFGSLARSYKEAIDELERNTDERYDELYIVGGGAKNTYLNELTESETQKKVIALPIEATALGNLKIQIGG